MKSHSRTTAFTYFSLRTILKPIIMGIWIRKVTGKQNIPKTGPAIVALNHQSLLDFLTFSVVSPRNIHFLAAEKFFTHPWWKILMKLTGQIKVERQLGDKSSVHAAVKQHMDKGTLIGIFPEGTRSHLRDEMLKAFTGIARYALEHKVPIIPVGIIGADDILSKTAKGIKFAKTVEIHIGEPLHFSEHWGMHTDKEICTLVTEKVMRQIEKLSGKKYPHYEHAHSD